MKTQNNPPSTTLVCGCDEFAEKLAYWEKRVNDKAAKMAELSLHLQDIKNGLAGFMGLYNSRVGIHYIKIDKLDLEIRTYLYRLQEIKKHGISVEVLKKIEKEIDEKFGEELKKLHEREQETQQSSNEYRKSLRDRERREMLSEDMQTKIRDMYRFLALKFHPDKAKNETEAGIFTDMMAAINEAYAKGDIGMLVIFMEKAERDEKIKTETPEEKLARLQKEDDDLYRMLQKLYKEREEIFTSDAWKLKIRIDEAFELCEPDLLAELTRRALNEIKQKQEELDELVDAYKKAIQVKS
jgi:hypothetical protein